MKTLLALSIAFGGLQVSALGATIPPGTEVSVRADQPLEVSKWDKGRIYPGHVARDVYARNGTVAIPRDSYAELIVRQVGPNQLALDLESVTVNGTRYAMDTTGPQFNANRGAYDNGSGLVGNIIGAITGVETRGDRIHVPAGSVIRFQLQEPMHVVTWADPGYTEHGYHYHHDHDWYR